MAGLSAPAAAVLPTTAAAEGTQARDDAAGAGAPAAAGVVAYPRRSSLHRAAASGRYRPSEALDPPVAPGPAWVAAVAAANAARSAPAAAAHNLNISRTSTSPRAACLAAARRAERTYGLPEGLMVAIALSESGLHANALNIGGRSHFPDDAATARAMLASAVGRSSVMAGCVQVNAGVHARRSDWPLDPQRAADWSGERLRRWHDETGSWTVALARWHGGGGASTRRVLCRVRAKLDVAAPGSPALRDVGCADAARVRRSGATLLEVAEAAR